MDIIICAPQGAGKTLVAQLLLMHRLQGKRYSDVAEDVFSVSFVGDNSSALAQKFREGKPEAILFDGCIDSPVEMLVAVDAVKKYREQTGRPAVMAVYVDQGGNCVLTDKPRRFTPGEVHNAKLSPSDDADRSLVSLRNLADHFVAAGGEEARLIITDRIQAFTFGVYSELGYLSTAQRTLMHEFLLTLLRDYEKV